MAAIYLYKFIRANDIICFNYARFRRCNLLLNVLYQIRSFVPMLLVLLALLIFSNATTTEKAKSILYNRMVSLSLFFIVWLLVNNLYYL